jgi:hypothetical protein
MLGQVLGRRLLGQAGAVQELTLEQGQVGLQEGRELRVLLVPFGAQVCTTYSDQREPWAHWPIG